MLFDYARDLRAGLWVNHHSVVPPDGLRATFSIEGTEGRCDGLIGLLLNYPAGRSDTLTFWHNELTPGGSIHMELEGRWFPDAFIGPMSSLMDSITNDTDPETSGKEALGTQQLLERVRQSHETKQTVQL
jgi:predicted dehydrogenase